MKLLLVPFTGLVIMALQFCSCQSGTEKVLFCDTTCMKDSMKFVDEAHRDKPNVYISASKCAADTVSWSYEGMPSRRKLELSDLAGAPVSINRDKTGCFIKDTSYAWLYFNDCKTGQGFQIKIPFDKKANIGRRSSGLNAFDPKFSVAPGLLAYSDRGNLYVEDMATGKSAMMTFREKADINYSDVHKTVDSIHVTSDRAWAKVLLKGEWKVFEKKIELK